MLELKKNLGGVSNRNIQFWLNAIVLLFTHMDGLLVVIQLTKDLTTVQLGVMLHLVVLSLMLITKLVYMLELKSLVQLQKLCLVNGNIKSDLAKV